MYSALIRPNARIRVGGTLLALLVLAGGVGAQSDPAAVFRRYEQAINRADLSGFLGVFADDAVLRTGVRCPPANPCVGKEAIQKRFFEPQVAANLRITPVSVQVNGTTVTARIEIRNDGVRAAGIDRIVGTDTVQVKGDNIVALQFTIDRSDPQSAAFLQAQQGPPAQSSSK